MKLEEIKTDIELLKLAIKLEDNYQTTEKMEQELLYGRGSPPDILHRMEEKVDGWRESVEQELQRRVDKARRAQERKWEEEDHWMDSFRK